MNNILREKMLPGEVCLQLVQGDLTKQKVEAIVNAANAYLQHGGGVAGAIVQQGGEVIQKESNAWVEKFGLVTPEKPAYTCAGELPCRYVIHAVGPIWGEGDEDRQLEVAVLGALRLAEKLSVKSIALPAISTGIFGFPKERAARIILQAIQAYFLAQTESSMRLVRLVLWDQPSVTAFLAHWV